MKYRFHPEARQELISATGHYKGVDTNLGKIFRKEIDEAISRVMEFPQAWPKIETGIRRCLTQRFPYSILYHFSDQEQEIFIVAVMHSRQKPGYWKGRKL